jgi:hypothetical protein
VAQRDAHAEVKVRGEFNRTFDANVVKDPTEGQFVFCAPEFQQYMLLVTPGKTDVVNGTVIVTPDFTAFFKNFLFSTRDPKQAEAIRGTDAFKMGRVQELGTLRSATRKNTIEAEAKRVAADPELTKAVLAQLKQGAAAAPQVAK